MTEPTTSPAAQPIQDKAPKPPGLMPKNIQTWVMLGLAVLMVSIMWLTGGKKPRPRPSQERLPFRLPPRSKSTRGKSPSYRTGFRNYSASNRLR